MCIEAVCANLCKMFWTLVCMSPLTVLCSAKGCPEACRLPVCMRDHHSKHVRRVW